MKHLSGYRSLCSIFFIIYSLSACQQGNHSAQDGQTQDSAANKTGMSASSGKQGDSGQVYFPVAEYLRAEIAYVDSTPLAIVVYHTEGARKDSAFIQQTVFDRLAQEFILPDLAQDKLQKDYAESSFQDATTGYLTFTYSPKAGEPPIRRIDVTTEPGTSANRVKSIYLERVGKSGDTLTMKKMFWEARSSFLIVTTLQPAGKPPVIRQLKVVWDTEGAGKL